MPGTDLLLARILSPLARSLDEARRHLALTPEAPREQPLAPAAAPDEGIAPPATAAHLPPRPGPDFTTPVLTTHTHTELAAAQSATPLAVPEHAAAPAALQTAPLHSSVEDAAPQPQTTPAAPAPLQAGAPERAAPLLAGQPPASHHAATATTAPNTRVAPAAPGAAPVSRPAATPRPDDAPPTAHATARAHTLRWRHLPLPVLAAGAHDSYDFRPLPGAAGPAPGASTETSTEASAPMPSPVMASAAAQPAPMPTPPQAAQITPARHAAPGALTVPVQPQAPRPDQPTGDWAPSGNGMAAPTPGQTPAPDAQPWPAASNPAAHAPQNTPALAPPSPPATGLRLHARPLPVQGPALPAAPAPQAYGDTEAPLGHPAPGALRAHAARLGAVDRAMSPVLDHAWQLSHTALLADTPPAPDALPSPGGPRINNHFHVNVAVDGRDGSPGSESQLEESLVNLLRDAARRQGLDV